MVWNPADHVRAGDEPPRIFGGVDQEDAVVEGPPGGAGDAPALRAPGLLRVGLDQDAPTALGQGEEPLLRLAVELRPDRRALSVARVVGVDLVGEEQSDGPARP